MDRVKLWSNTHFRSHLKCLLGISKSIRKLNKPTNRVLYPVHLYVHRGNTELSSYVANKFIIIIMFLFLAGEVAGTFGSSAV